jgi:AcrR family transcriptional regulator
MDDTPGQPRAVAARERLQQAAVEAFAEKGFHGTTTRDIATSAGMSPAALYVHHRSKEELLYRLSRAGHERTLRLVKDAVASSEDPVTALRRVVHDFAVDHAVAHTSARVVNYELAALAPGHYKEIRDVRRRIEQSLRELVERGVDEGEFDVPDVRIATVALLSLGIDLARWYREGGRWTPEQIADHYAELALRIVGAHRPSGCADRD